MREAVQQQEQQQQQQQGPGTRWRWSPLHREECRFLWNRELLSLLLQQQQAELISEGFFLLLLHGSVQQQVLHTQGVLLQLLTISRRSAAFAGPRYGGECMQRCYCCCCCFWCCRCILRGVLLLTAAVLFLLQLLPLSLRMQVPKEGP